MKTQILRTKLYIPPPKPTLTPRPHLINQLNNGLAKKVIVISAPAGFGKTTLIADWVAQMFVAHGLGLAWLALDVRDNDLDRFLSYFIAAFQEIEPTLGANGLAMVEASPPEATPVEAVLTSLINDIVGETATSASLSTSVFTLILDDYHLIESQPIHDAIAFFIEHLPPPPTGMTLVIASRTDPPLPLPRWRVRGEMVELRGADLAFSLSETAVFLHTTTGLTLSETETSTLNRRTEGWIAGLQMAALSLQGRDPATISDFIQTFAGSHHYILDYLTAEVLHQQPDHIQSFLLHTSILERLSAPLCDAIIQDPIHPSSSIIHHLEQANLFIIPLDDERRWYRYHHLFADLLRNRLTATQPEQVSQLHQRASQWYETANLLEETMAHAFQAADNACTEPSRSSRLARLIEKYAHDMLHQSKYSLLSSWIEALPSAQVAAQPWLCVYQSWTRHWAGLRAEGEASLQIAERHLAQTPSPTPENRLLAGYIATVRAHYALTNGDLKRVLEQSQKALRLLPENDYFTRSTAAVALGGAYWGLGDSTSAIQTYIECAADALQGGYPYRASSALCYKGIQQVKQARLPAAQETFLEALALASSPEGDYFPNAGYPLAKLGELACEWNDLDAANQLAHEGVVLCTRLGHVDLMAEALVALARVQLAQAAFDAVADTLQQADRLLQKSKVDSWIYGWLNDCRLRLWLATDRLDEVSYWLETCGLTVAEPLNYLDDLNHINLARALLAVGKQDGLLALLARLLTAAETAVWHHEAIKILVLQALTHQALGDEAAALVALTQALELAEPGGYLRTFWAEGEAMARLLRAIEAANSTSYASKILAAWGLNNAALVEPLSQRELEVLQLVATGLPNKSIAETLFIAPSTVKKHLKNIYQKLNVHSRTEAVARVRELDILE